MFVYNLLMDTEPTNKSKVRKRKAALNASFCVKKERNTLYQKVSTILQKPAAERSKDEAEFLSNSKDVVKQITLRKAQRQKVKDRAQEYEDPSDVLEEKCKTLAEAVINSNHLVVYTGAGISTAACIPDYRGSNGIWTLLQQGKDIGLHDLSLAEPTLTHMALYCLYRSGILKHIVSQNCDGLHLRSGIPRSILSEVHGNMYLEVCTKCKPSNHYLRLFDVTEYTARYSHETLRLCYKCGTPLKDTIVHFGERGKLQWPLNWDTACKQADKADVILCLGSSLKVLKKYPWLWCMDKPVKKRPKLYIVNLQWTPKDDQSTLKINGKCDTVIEQMMARLELTIPSYVRHLDPIFYHATLLHETEVHTTSRIPIKKNLLKPNLAAVSSSLEDAKDDSVKKMKNEVSKSSVEKVDTESHEAIEASTNDLSSSSISLINIHVKKENYDEKANLVNNSESLEMDPEDEPRNREEGNSVYVKTELIDEDEENNTTASAIIDQEDNCNLENVAIKEETLIDASSDKENHEIPNSNSSTLAENVSIKNESADQSKKPVLPCDVEIKVQEGEDRQSSVTVIPEEATVQSIEETIEVKKELMAGDDTDGKNNDQTKPASEENSNGLNFMCGRSLWSDLSVFDTLTNQPILFGRSILGWSDMNSYSYNSKALVDLSNRTAAASEGCSSTDTKERGCIFCLEYYCSRTCLFYLMSASNTPLDAASPCLCCGGEEDEDEQQQPDEPEEDDDKAPPKAPNVNPGWFGKGYRKKVKKRK